ncbi:hypothetical protein Tco_1073511 [Tanacetum coccineum]
MPSRPDLSFAGLDDSVYKTKVGKNETSISKTSKDIVEKPKTVRPSAPIIEDWDTDSDNKSVFRPKSDQTKPKFTKINFVKSDENVKSVNKENTHRQVKYPRKSQSHRDNRRNWNELMTQKLGNGFESIKKSCFVCGSFNHLIKDSDFHDKKMIEKPMLNNKGRVIDQREIRPQSSPRVAASISTARPVNTDAPKLKVNDALPKTYSYFKAHSLVRRAFHQKSTAKTNNLNEKVKTSRVNNVTTAGPKAVVSAAGNPQYTLQDQGIFDSGCSRHMTGNKSFLIDYQEVDGGFVAFAGSPKGEVGEGSGSPTEPQHTSTTVSLSNLEPITVLSQSLPKKTLKPRKAKRTTEISQSSRPIHLVADDTLYKECEDRMERAATTASSLEAEQNSGNINRTQSMATLNESLPQGTDSGSGPRCQVTILGVQKLKLGLRLHLNTPMIHLSQELTHLEVGKTT